MAPKSKMPAREDIERLTWAATMLRACATDPVCRRPPEGMADLVREFAADWLLRDKNGAPAKLTERAAGDVAAVLAAYRQVQSDETMRVGQIAKTLDALETRIEALDETLNGSEIGRTTRLMLEDAIMLQFTAGLIQSGKKADDWRAKHGLAPMFPALRDGRRKRLAEDVKKALASRLSLAAAGRAATGPGFPARRPIYAEVLDTVIGNDPTHEADQIAEMAAFVEKNLFSADKGLVQLFVKAISDVRTSLPVTVDADADKGSHGGTAVLGPTDSILLAWGALELYKAWRPEKPGTSHPLKDKPSSSPSGTFVGFVRDLHALANGLDGKPKSKAKKPRPEADGKKKKEKAENSLTGAGRVKLVLAAEFHDILKPTAFQGLRPKNKRQPPEQTSDDPAIRPQPEQRGRTWNPDNTETHGDWSMVPDEPRK